MPLLNRRTPNQTAITNKLKQLKQKSMKEKDYEN